MTPMRATDDVANEVAHRVFCEKF